MPLNLSGGGRSIPELSINIGKGRSQDDIKAIQGAIEQLTKAMEGLATNGEQAAKALTAALEAQAKGSERTKQAAKPLDELTQRYKAFGEAQRRVRMEQQLNTANDPVEQRYKQMVAESRRTARERAVRTGALPEESVSGRLANALGWAPFVPGGQTAYLGQMAAQALLPGISGAAMLGITAPLVLGAAALGAADFTDTHIAQGRQAASIAGGGAGVSALGEDLRLHQAMNRTGVLDSKNAMDIVQGLSAGGVSPTDSLGKAFDLAAEAVNTFQLNIADATKLIATSMVDLGMTADQTNRFMASIASESLGTGTSAQQLAQVAANNPDLMALTGGAGFAQFADVLTQIGGTAPERQKLAGNLAITGYGGQALATQLGMSYQEYTTNQQSGAGLLKNADAERALLQGKVAQFGFGKGLDQYNALLGAVGGQPLTIAEATQQLGLAGATPYQTQAATDAASVAAAAQAKRTQTGQDRFAAQQALDLASQGQAAASSNAAVSPGPTDLAKAQAETAAIGTADAMLGPPAPDGSVGGPLGDLLSTIGGALAGLMGGAGNSGVPVRVQGQATVTVRTTDASGRVTGTTAVDVPLAEGNQQASQYQPNPAGSVAYHAPGKGPLQ